jgi:hypothetical protein
MPVSEWRRRSQKWLRSIKLRGRALPDDPVAGIGATGPVEVGLAIDSPPRL